MTTIYVRTGGNDTTGTGLTGAPYLTLKKALSVAAAGDFILMGDGTYAEDSGSGFLSVTNAFGTRVTVAPETSGPGKVTIKGTSGSYAVVIGNAQNIHFDGLTFEGQATTTLAAVRFIGSATLNLMFTRCTFRAFSVAGSTNQGVISAWTTAASNNHDIVFDSCTFDQIGPYQAAGMLLDNAGAGSTVSAIEVRGCTFTVGYYGLRMLGITNARVHGNTFDSWSPLVSGHAFQFGVDGPSGVACSGVITGNTFRTLNSHAVVIGAGSNGVLFAGNRAYGGANSSNGQGVVVKEAQNVRVERNVITGGYNSGLYFKAAVDCQAFENIVYNEFANSPALRVDINSETSNACQRLSVRRNYFHAVLGTVLGWAGASGDSGGSTCDENVYVVAGTATLGSVRGNTVTKLSELRAAWSGYDRTVNDRNSRIGAKGTPFGGVPFVDLPA